MRRVHFVILTLLPFTASASAQTRPSPEQMHMAIIGSSVAVTTATPENVVARILSFDSDRDGVVVKEELPERMHNLLTSDSNGDGALDRSEIHVRAMASLVPATAMATVPPQPFGGGGGYTFGDQVSLSTRSHVEGALADLRLDGYKTDRALPIIHAFMNRVEAVASDTLVRELEPLMTANQIQNLERVLDMQFSTKGKNVTMTMPPPFNKTRQFFMRGGPNLEIFIQAMGLPQEKTKEALAAVERFKASIRPGDAERAELMAKLTDVLSDEERENYDAALARRPLVKAGAVAGVVGGGFNLVKPAQPGSVGSAIFVMPSQPQKPVLVP